MTALLFLLCFLLGAVAVFVAGKIQLKNREKNLTSNVDDPDSGIISKPDDANLPEPSQQALDSLNLINQKTNTEIAMDPSIETEPKPFNLLQKTIDDLYIVNELGQNVTSSLDLQETFHHLYTTINSMMDAAVLELSVWNEGTAQWKLFTNLAPHSIDANPQYHNHFAEWCFKNNREVFLTDAEHDYERYVFKPLKMPDGRIVKSLLAFPIVHDERVSGTLCIISFRNNSFTEYHLKIIRMLLGYIAVAMQNAITHEELQVTKQRAERSEKFMQQFLANMSHEIRTPMNAVMGMTNILLQKNPQQDQLKYLNTIQKSSENLLVILNDILDLSKIEAGKIEFEKIDFSVFDVVHNVREIIRIKAEEKGLQLLTSVDDNIAPVLTGDPIRLTQVLINLVGNAIKFTEKGNVKINVNKVVTNHSSIESLHFEISDSGIGMTDEQQQKLFQSYAQASTDTARKYGGTGLGLSISKQLVQLQGGTIDVRSRSGEGSTFMFSLSYPVSKSKDLSRKEKTINASMLNQLKDCRILLADDNEYNRIVIKETLELKIGNIHIDEAYDGLMVIEMLQKNDYDLILMDLVMPNLDGTETTEKIRKEFGAPKCDIPILALTASVVKSEIDRCFASGMNGFIPKPFKTHELLGAIYQAIHGDNEDVFEEVILQTEVSVPTGEVVDLNYLREFTEGDTQRLKKLLDLFVKLIPGYISNFKTALEIKDYERIRVIAHSIKPQLRFTGVMQGLELAETIEHLCAEKTELQKIPELIHKLSSICEKAVDEINSTSI